MLHNIWLAKLAKLYSLANQKLCCIQIYKILEKKTKDVLMISWWIKTQILWINDVMPCLVSFITQIYWASFHQGMAYLFWQSWNKVYDFTYTRYKEWELFPGCESTKMDRPLQSTDLYRNVQSNLLLFFWERMGRVSRFLWDLSCQWYWLVIIILYWRGDWVVHLSPLF